MPEPTGHELPAIDDAGVGGEHEVRQIRVRLEHLDFCAGRSQRLYQAVPLFAGPVRVDRHLPVHPRVDLVQHAEMIRRTHQVPEAPAEGHARYWTRYSARRPRKRPTSVTRPRA